VFFEPPRTAYDLNFRIFGVPVRVHPFFWLAMVLLFPGGDPTPRDALIWVVAAFVSITAHELGHVVAITVFGSRAYVVLHGFGGLAIDQWNRRRTPPQQILISLAGPAAGFLLIGLVVLGIKLTGTPVAFEYRKPLGFLFGSGIESATLNRFVWFLWIANIYWGLLNLLPIYPLDGGQATAAMFLWNDPGDGLRKAITLSFGIAVMLVVFAILNLGFNLTAVFFGYLAYENYQMLQSLRGGYRGSQW
jgi:Zn-dependent protease